MELHIKSQQYIIDRVTIDPQTDCWLWTKYKNKHGYGVVGRCWITRHYQKPLAHQISYIVFNGPYDPDLLVRHKCRNRHCCNPAHLETGTIQDNAKDRIRDGTDVGNKGNNRGTKHGQAKLTEQQVLTIRSLYSTGEYQQIELATMFGISKGAVSAIITNRSWSHI